MRGFAVAATCGEAADAADGVAQCEAGRKRITSSKRWHVVFPDVPGCGRECGEQASGKNSARLQRVDAEDLAGMSRVVAPLVDDVKHLGSENAAEYDQNAQVPGLVAVNSEALGIAHTDPQADQDTHGHQESIGRQEKLS